MQMQQRMLPHYIVKPNQYTLKPSDEWMEDDVDNNSSKTQTQQKQQTNQSAKQ